MKYLKKLYKQIFNAIIVVGFLSICIACSTYIKNREMEKVFMPSINRKVIDSHYQIPIVLSEWEYDVIEKYGRNSLALYYEKIYYDLPPCKAENDSDPQNRYLYHLIQKDTALAKRVILDALQAAQWLPQWSIINVCKDFRDNDFVQPLINIARADPNKTDRASAYKTLLYYNFENKYSILHEGLFDNYFSVRYLCMELLGRQNDRVADLTAIMPIYPRNPFHYLFRGKAFQRLFEKDSSSMINLQSTQLIEEMKKIDKISLDEYKTLAEKFQNKPYSALVLYVLGDSIQQVQSLDKIEKILLEQGKGKDFYWSEDFWLGTDITQVLSSSDNTNNLKAICTLLDKYILEYNKEKNNLLITLCYVFSKVEFKECEETLLKIRYLKKAHPDLYLAAAEALAKQNSLEAFPSLLKILENDEQPFFYCAIRTLEDLTKLKTPGQPVDESILNNLKSLEMYYDVKKARSFWKNWYAENKKKIYYDNELEKFNVK